MEYVREKARELLQNRMEELGYPFSSHYEKETLTLMLKFGHLVCELQKQECTANISEKSYFTKNLILNTNNVCNE